MKLVSDCAVWGSYTDDLVSLVQLPAQVGRASGQDEGDEDALPVLSSHDVEA